MAIYFLGAANIISSIWIYILSRRIYKLQDRVDFAEHNVDNLYTVGAYMEGEIIEIQRKVKKQNRKNPPL